MLRGSSDLSSTTETNLDRSKPAVVDKVKKEEHVNVPREKSKTQGYVKVTVEEELKRAESLDAIETGLYMSKSPVIDKAKLQECVKLFLREEVQKEIEKHNIDNVVRSDLQKYQQGEVLTPQLLEALIARSMEQVMDKFNEQLEKK